MLTTRPRPRFLALRLILGFPLIILAGLVAGAVGALVTPPAGWRGDE